MKPDFKKNIIFSSIFIFFIVLNLAYFFALPAIINIEKYKPEIREYLMERVSVPLVLGKLDIDMTWNLGIKIKIDKAFLRKPNGSKFVTIGDSCIELSLLPLLNNHVVIREAVINNLDGIITKTKDGTFDINKIFAKKGKAKYKVEFKNTSINLSNYKLNFIDKNISPEKDFVFSGKNLKIENFTPYKYIKIQAVGAVSELKKTEMLYDLTLDADLPLKKIYPTKNRLKIRGIIEKFDLSEFKPYINRYSTRYFSDFTGIGSVNFDIDLNTEIVGKRKFFINSKINNLNISSGLREKKESQNSSARDEFYGNILSHKGSLIFQTNGNFDNNDLYLDNFQVNGKGLNTSIKGKISNFARKKIRNVDLNVEVEGTRAKTAAEIFPKNINVALDPFNKIIKHNIDGNISGNITAKGYYKRPALFGKIKYDDFSVVEKVPDSPNGYGSVDFLGSTLVLDSTQYLSKNGFVKTTGTIVPFKGKKVNLKINSTQNIDFATTLPVLLAVRDMFQFKLAPVTEMDITGRGKVSLDIVGAFKDVTINGYVETKNVTVKYKTLASKAENVNGKVKFDGEKVFYDDLSGVVEGIKLIPSGYSTLHGYSDIKLYMPNLDLKKGQKFIYGSPLLKKVQVSLKDIMDIKGVADTTIFLKGTEEKLDSSGIIKFVDAYLTYKGYGEAFNDLKGQLRYDNENILMDNINGNVLKNNVTVDGFVAALSKNIDLSITSKNINLEDAKKFVMNSSLMSKAQKIVNDFSFIKGTASFKLKLKGKSNDDCLESLLFDNTNAVFIQKNTGFPIKIVKGTFTITDDSVQTPGMQASIANTDFTVKGKVSNLKANIKTKAPVVPDIELQIRNFNVAMLKDTAKSSLIPNNLRKILADITPSSLPLHSENNNIFVRINQSGFKAKVNFDNFAMNYSPYDLPLVIENGKAEITDKTVYFSGINGKISNSGFFINGTVKNYLKKPSFETELSMEVNPEDSDRLSSLFKQPVDMKNSIPIVIKLKGGVDNWNVLAKMALNKGTSLSFAKQIGLPDDKVRMIALEAQGKSDRIDIKRMELNIFGRDTELNNQLLRNVDITDEKDKILHISGSIDRLKSQTPIFKSFRVYTNNEKPLSLCILNPGVSKVINNGNDKFFSEGNVKADLTINGSIFNPDIAGFISFYGLKIPDYKLSLGDANVSFTKDNINLNLKGLKIDDSSMDIKALLDYSWQTPLMVRDINITSDYMNIDKIAAVFLANKDLINSSTEDIKATNFVIQNGTLDSKELIMRDMIISNVKADVNFTPDGLLSVSDIQMKAAGGVGTGNLYYNAKSTELSLNLKAKNMQANALATTLLRFPNEVYGTLNGEGQFYTSGRNSEEMISNSNGYADFKIYDGRLVRLGSLEYFLRAANVMQSGIGGLNVNNVIDLVIPQKTGYFDKLEGKLDIKDGVINTEEITSSGDNLSLFISGNFDMLTNYADAKILGKLSKKVLGLLGPLGSVSVNQVIGYIPGFGFLPTAAGEKGLIDLIPGLSKIPVLGLDFNKKNRQFEVDINGNLYEQSSVKSFRWLD